MTKRFKIGDRVSWNSEAGRVSGTIIRVHTQNVLTTAAETARIHIQRGNGTYRPIRSVLYATAG